MDSIRFVTGLKWGYTEVSSRSDGRWILLIDNNSGHEVEHDLPGLRIEYLPANTTALYQILDMGLIAA